jgi:hypothetical protein
VIALRGTQHARVDLLAVDGALWCNGRRVSSVQDRVVAKVPPRSCRQVPQVRLAAAAEAVLILYLQTAMRVQLLSVCVRALSSDRLCTMHAALAQLHGTK